MTLPIGGIPAQVAAYLQELEDRVAGLEDLKSPRAPYACAQADLPSPATYINAVVYVTDVKRLAHSDGTNWKRADTGANL